MSERADALRRDDAIIDRLEREHPGIIRDAAALYVRRREEAKNLGCTCYWNGTGVIVQESAVCPVQHAAHHIAFTFDAESGESVPDSRAETLAATADRAKPLVARTRARRWVLRWFARASRPAAWVLLIGGALTFISVAVGLLVVGAAKWATLLVAADLIVGGFTAVQEEERGGYCDGHGD